MVSSASDPPEEWLGLLLEEIRSQLNWAPGSGFLNNCEYLLNSRLARNTLPIYGWALKAGLVDMPDYSHCSSGSEETALHALYYCERVGSFWSHVGEWTARIDSKQLVVLNIGYIVSNVDPPYEGEKRVVFLVLLAVNKMVI